jgi:hypothetical protein
MTLAAKKMPQVVVEGHKYWYSLGLIDPACASKTYTMPMCCYDLNISFSQLYKRIILDCYHLSTGTTRVPVTSIIKLYSTL